jgi:hypothetical protein
MRKPWGPSKTAGVQAESLHLNPEGPAQMAIPLQMEKFPKQLVAALRRVKGESPRRLMKE